MFSTNAKVTALRVALLGRDGLLYACVPREMDQGDERAHKVAGALAQLLNTPAA